MGRGGIDISAGDKLKLVNSGSVIENCKISNLSRIDRTYTPAIVVEGDGTKVRNCLFSNIPSSGIRLEGNDMLIELNEFTKCVIESDDQGAIDVWGNPLLRGNIIRWNFFHDIGIPDLHMAAGVRLDDAISGFSIYENLFLRSSNNHFGGIQIHGGKDNFIEGNIFADCHAAISQSAWGDKRWQEAINSPEHPMYKAIHATGWQSESWLLRYPALKNLLTDPDINFASDNLVINAETFILRKSKKFEVLNNELIKAEKHPAVSVDFKGFLVPWHSIPVERIGPYK
jgi:Right handed beta helix region